MYGEMFGIGHIFTISSCLYCSVTEKQSTSLDTGLLESRLEKFSRTLAELIACSNPAIGSQPTPYYVALEISVRPPDTLSK
jgi:hypothetical protein